MWTRDLPNVKLHDTMHAKMKIVQKRFFRLNFRKSLKSIIIADEREMNLENLSAYDRR